VWLEKTGQLDGQFKAGEAAEIGTMVEDALLDWCAAEIGAKITKNQRRVCGVLAANHDALVKDRPWGLEAKTTGILSPHVAREEWGEAGTDQVPDRVLVQCHHQMIVSDLELVWVPALIGGRGRVLFEVKRNAELFEAMRVRLTDWWNTYVEQHLPPQGCAPSLETLKRVRREPASSVEVPEGLLEKWTEAKLILSAAQTQEENAKAALLTALGSAEQGTCMAGVVTYMEQGRTFVDNLVLREKYPDIAAECERSTTFRVLRFKKPKAAK
jgi:predicted phage-related endonuclease